MATKKEAPKKSAKKAADPEKEAKRKARMEALKNRPAVQRPNSKQIDVIEVGKDQVIQNYGYPIKNREGHVGVLVTSVAIAAGKIVSTSTTFVPGNLTVKAKKNHGTITSPKKKGEVEETAEDED